MASVAALSSLQAHLLALKTEYGRAVKLTKTSEPSKTAPFPVVLSMVVLVPEDSRVDLSSFKVIITAQAGAVDRELTIEQRADSVQVEVASPDFARRLALHIAATLKHRWQDRFLAGQGADLQLGSVFEDAKANALVLFATAPECVEAYEAVGASGASVRRYAVLASPSSTPMSNLLAATSRQQPIEEAPCSERPASEHQGTLQPTGPQQASRGEAKGDLSPTPPTLPPALEKEAVYLQRRFGAAAALRTDFCGEDAGAPCLAFTIALQPTDPEWPAAVPAGSLLMLEGFASPSYPAAGAWRVAAADSAVLPPHVCVLLSGALGREAGRLAGRTDALRALLRYVDNHAGALVRAADDALLEAAHAHSRAPQDGRGSLDMTSSHAPQDSCSSADGGLSGFAARRSLFKAGISTAVDSIARKTAGLNLGLPQAAQHQPATSALRSTAGSSTQCTDTASMMGFVPDDAAVSHQAPPCPSVGDGDAAGGRPEATGSPGDEGTRGDSSGWYLTSSAGERSGPSGACSVADSESSSAGLPCDEDGAGLGGSLEPCNAGAATGNGANVGLGLRALGMRLEGLKMDNIDALEPCRLGFQVACARCGGLGDVCIVISGAGGFSAPSSQSGQCGQCYLAWEMTAVPRLVTEVNNVLAWLRAEGCAPVDLVRDGCLLGAQCAGCSSAAAFRGVQVGARAERSCSHCHRAMAVRFEAARFEVRGTERQRATGESRRSGARGAAAGAQPRGADPAMQRGEPLPDLGTCRHYRHSHRWLRFPCCGRRFPCDLCHEEGTDGHEMKWAQRMVCGYCSVEQPLGERCSSCGKRIARRAAGPIGASTRFWEGGQGCRDPKRLDRRDARKHRGSKFKTQSKKAARVGAAGAQRRDGRAAQ